MLNKAMRQGPRTCCLPSEEPCCTQTLARPSNIVSLVNQKSGSIDRLKHWGVFFFLYFSEGRVKIKSFYWTYKHAKFFYKQKEFEIYKPKEHII